MGVASDILMALSVSYVDRAAASDPARASILLSKVSSIWPSLATQWATEQGLSPQGLPAQIPAVWDGITRLIVARALPDGGSSSVRALADQIGSSQLASQIGPIARRYLEYIPPSSASRRFAENVAAQDIGALATGLDNQIAIIAAGGTFAPPSARSGQVFNPSVVQQFRVPSQAGLLDRALQSAGRTPVGVGTESNPISLPGTTITASSGGIGIPMWGWIVGGIVITAGLGFFAWKKWGSA